MRAGRLASAIVDFRLRPGSLADNPALHELFRDAVEGLAVKLGVMDAGPVDRDARRARWEWLYEPLMRHLTETAEAFVVAEDDAGLLGYGRATNRDGLRELTEFFVAPQAQGRGVGRELLRQVFPPDGAERLVIVATLDHRAQNRYLGAGCYPEVLMVSIGGAAQPRDADGTLHAEPIDPGGTDAARCGDLDEVVLGHRRDVDHVWLASHRPGFCYYRGRRLVGYGYVGPAAGPVAALEPEHMPAMLDHLEAALAATGEPEIWWDVPGVNRVALAHLKQRGHLVTDWFTVVMADRPFGCFDRYMVTTPTFFL